MADGPGPTTGPTGMGPVAPWGEPGGGLDGPGSLLTPNVPGSEQPQASRSARSAGARRARNHPWFRMGLLPAGLPAVAVVGDGQR
jgi:hypothetical protein